MSIHLNGLDSPVPASARGASGRISPATRASVRAWLSPFAGADAHFALEATTGWRFVVEELERAGL